MRKIMKLLQIKYVIIIYHALVATAQGGGQISAPPFLPEPPPITKELINYSAADVFGVICRSNDSLPAGHPFRGRTMWVKNYIANNWPGAQDPSNIDAVLKYLCDSDDVSIGMVAGDVEWYMTCAMNVSDEIKIQSIIRVRNAQTDSIKKMRIESFGKRMFLVLFDPRLLFWSQDELDDATLLPQGPQKYEGRINPDLTKRGAALKERLDYLKIIGQITDKTPFNGPDEAANCQAMKDLINTSWSEIVHKCAQKRVDPARKFRDVSIHTWDAPSAP